MTDIALFGMTGDLARHKLIPSLFRLFLAGTITKDDSLIGFGRKPFSAKELRSFVIDHAGKSEEAKSFARLWTYIQSELDDDAGYLKLDALLGDDAVIYLSLPPDLQARTAARLVSSGTVTKGSERRIAFEKPFGQDLKSAKKLQAFLEGAINEEQVLRVDHYAGKAALLDLEKSALLGVLAPLFNAKKIKSIEVRLHEEKGIEGRGAFYDQVGAINDIGQSHLFHMLATVLAVPLVEDSRRPSKKEILSLSRARSLALRHVRLDLSKSVLGQYEGFTREAGVNPDSATETFFSLRGKIADPAHARQISRGDQGLMLKRWKGIEVRISGGKGLSSSDVSIYLELKGSREMIRIPVNGYGSKSAHDEIFEAAIRGNMERFMDFRQVESSWELAESAKKSPGRILAYAKGTTPKS